MHDSVPRLSGSNCELFFQTIGQGPALPAVSHTKLEFINGAPCPVSIDRQSFFMVGLKYGEVCSIKRLVFLLMRMALAQYQSCLSILLISYIGILLVNDEISSSFTESHSVSISVC